MRLSHDTPPQGTLREWIDARASERGAEPAFVFPEGEAPLSWVELRDHAARIARGLVARGIGHGQSVAIMMPNGRDAALALYGVLYGGFRATMINLVAGADAVGYALGHSGAQVVFAGGDALELLSRACPDDAPAVLDLAALDGPGPLYPVAPGDHALLMYTSGTTGRPKGVVHSQTSLLAGGWTTAVAHGLGPGDRGLCVLPIYHINGLCVSVMGALVSGGSLAMCPRFSASRFWDQVAATQATWFSVVPTVISHLLHAPANPDAASRARLRFGRSASAPLAPDVQRAFETRFEVPIIETMGLTETAAQILSNPMPPAPRKIGSPGIAFGNEVAVVGPDFAPLAADTEGELVVRGPNVMLEYLRNPQATADGFTPDGWLRTGDLGRMDAEGYVFVTGRLKELIIKGGENIAPREIDEALYSHADVIEAAAFARPCKTYGETVEAAVRVRSGSALTPEALIAICHERLGPFKSPDAVYFLADLPKGPSGKIQRRKLVELTGHAPSVSA